MDTHPPGELASPVSFTTPEGDKGRIWISDRESRKGEELYWRVNIADCPRERPCGYSVPVTKNLPAHIIATEGNRRIPLTRLKANPPARDPDCVQADTWPRPRGYKVRLCIEAEKELQILGCGWRVVIVELDGSKVHLHHNGNIATMKREAFKEFIAANKRLRRKRPVLRLVVSNPPPVVINSEAA